MHAIIHIGTGKTGTSSIQSFLLANHEHLRRQGCLYPRSLTHPERSRLGLLADHNDLVRCLIWGRRLDLLTPLRRELSGSGCHRLLLSAEMLCSNMRTPEHVQRLRHFLKELGCGSFSVAVWLREPGTLFASMCSQTLRSGRPEDLHWLTPPGSPWLCTIMDNRALLQRWGEVFGRQALAVRLFERECFVQGDLLADAISAFGLEWDEQFVIPERINETLNLLEMEVLRVLNRLQQGHALHSVTPKSLIFEVLHRHAGALEGPQLRFAPPQAVVQAWREWAAEGNEWVRREFFPDRPALFAPPRAQAENYALTALTPGAWEALGRTLRDLGEENFRLRRELQRLRTQGGAAEKFRAVPV